MPTNKTSREGFIKVTGGKVWYKIVGEKKGIPLVTLHGGPGYPHESLESLEDLKNEREVIFYDQLGCGNSERPNDKSLWTVQRFVEELSQIIKTLNLETFHIYGHSWGTGLAVSYALTQPKGLKGLILADSFLSTAIWEKDANKLLKKLPNDLQKILTKHSIPGVVNSDEFKKAAEEYYKQFVYRMNERPEPVKRANEKTSKIIYNHMWGPKEFAPTGTLKNFDVTDRISEIDIPVLLLSGRFDEVTPETTEYFKSLFPHAEMKIFENSAHLPHWTDREEFMKAVQAFLKQID